MGSWVCLQDCLPPKLLLCGSSCGLLELTGCPRVPFGIDPDTVGKSSGHVNLLNATQGIMGRHERVLLILSYQLLKAWGS